MSSPILKYFAFEHLPPNLQEVSKPIGELARAMDEKLPDGAEKSAGLRKLLEAKDCLVRALLPIVIFLFAMNIELPSAPAQEKFGGYTYDELGCYQPGPNVVRAENRDDAGDYRRWLAVQRENYYRRLKSIDRKYASDRPLNPPGNREGTDEPLVRVTRHDAERYEAWEGYKAKVGGKEAAKGGMPNAKLPLAPNKKLKVKPISLSRPGYTCGPNGCYPTKAAASAPTYKAGSRAPSRGGLLRRLRGR